MCLDYERKSRAPRSTRAGTAEHVNYTGHHIQAKGFLAIRLTTAPLSVNEPESKMKMFDSLSLSDNHQYRLTPILD